MQPRADLTTVPRSPDGEKHAAASSPPRRAVPASSSLAVVLTDLSSIICRIRGLQQLHADDDGLEHQLRRTEAELEALIGRLLHVDSAEPSPPPAPRTSTTAPRRVDAEPAFLAWLAEPTSANEPLLAGSDEPERLTPVLGQLTSSTRTLPSETAINLGLPDGTTVGHVAAELLIAVDDPAGPRCGSYRAAVYSLRELDRGSCFEPADGTVRR